MLKIIEVEAKTLQDATKKASEILKISEDKIQLEIIREKRISWCRRQHVI